MNTLPANDLSPNLLEFITQQQELIARQQEQIAQQQEQLVQLQEREVQQQIRIEALEAEITRLKKLNPKPNIKANIKPPDPPVSEEHSITPEAIPEGSVRHGRESFTVQELEVKAKTVRYWLEQWLTPEGKTISGRPPDILNGHHFGPQLQAFALLQHYGCAVTQPQLLELFWGAGISISAGQLSNLLTKGHDGFHAEKDELLATGIRCSHYLQTDDTGVRYQGQNGYCTVIVNDLFTWFGTTGSESQIREHIERRKISGGTRSEAGRQCRDTRFIQKASLKKTCRHHGLSFWDYLTDRLNGTGSFPRLADIIKYVSFWLSCDQCRGV